MLDNFLRLAVFFYAVLLHGLVFAVLYKLALTESCRHEMGAKWHEKYINHMQVSRRFRVLGGQEDLSIFIQQHCLYIDLNLKVR